MDCSIILCSYLEVSVVGLGFSADQLREAAEATREGAARFVSVQNEYGLLHREPERDVLPECERLGIAFIPYSPLANGLLTGKYRRGKGVPRGAAWTIAAATSPEQTRSNAAAARWELTDTELMESDSIATRPA
jgi:aryl-alcohol dehydrogenase-like predicted oxidoreductase